MIVTLILTMTLINFLWQLITENDWETATERSWFQGVAIVTTWLVLQ